MSLAEPLNRLGSRIIARRDGRLRTSSIDAASFLSGACGSCLRRTGHPFAVSSPSSSGLPAGIGRSAQRIRGVTRSQDHHWEEKKAAFEPVVASGKIRQRKHTAENRPGEGRQGSLSRTGFQPVFASHRSLCRQMSPCRVGQAKHQSPAEKVVRNCHRDLIVARFEGKHYGAVLE
jgi:hypothetical protein